MTSSVFRKKIWRYLYSCRVAVDAGSTNDVVVVVVGTSCLWSSSSNEEVGLWSSESAAVSVEVVSSEPVSTSAFKFTNTLEGIPYQKSGPFKQLRTFCFSWKNGQAFWNSRPSNMMLNMTPSALLDDIFNAIFLSSSDILCLSHSLRFCHKI